MSIDRFKALFPNIQITSEQEACCRFLERRGQRFCVDFGYENAPGIVWSELDTEDNWARA